jgi:conjugal transfer pilus assembly protein TraW
MHTKTIFIMSVLLSTLLLPGAVYPKDLGISGTVFEIAEKDALQELEDKAKSINWEQYLKKSNIRGHVENYKPQDLSSLPKAKTNRTYTVDMTYTLSYDIPDGKGGILYPKGYSFNPLQYVSYNQTLVFINGADKSQIEWFKQSAFYKEIKVKVLLTDGSYVKIMKDLKIPVFYATNIITERFNISAVPAVVTFKNQAAEVREVYVK